MYFAYHLVSTPENVELRFELAGLGNRGLACFIDTFFSYAIIGLFWGIGALILYGLKYFFHLDNYADLWTAIFVISSAVGILISFLILFGYFIFFEGLWHGQTPGKKIAGIRVVRENGEPISWMNAFLRNLLRLVDEGVFLIGMIFIIVEKSERRLGDLAAGTIVIRERPSARSLIFRSVANAQTNPDSPADSFVDMSTASQLNQADYDLVNDFLWRRRYMLKSVRKEMANKLAKYIASKLSPPAQFDAAAGAEPYLEKLSVNQP